MDYDVGIVRRRTIIPPAECFFAAPRPSSSTLKNGLIAYWQLEEASGTRADSHTNSLTLSESGSVGNTTGIVGNAASTTSGGNILFHADDPLFDFSGGLSSAFWIRFPTALPTSGIGVVGKLRSASEWNISFDTGDSKLVFNTFDGVGSSSIRHNTFGALSANTWYFLAVTADNSNIKISVNAGTQDSTAQSGVIVDTSEFFRLGDQDFTGNLFLDQVGLWGRALTAAEITQLYNSGAGRAYSGL